MKNKLLHQFWTLICAFCLFSSMLLIASPSYALSVKDVPNPRLENGGWVTDMVDMLSPSAEKKLNQIISDLETKNGTEIAVVTVVLIMEVVATLAVVAALEVEIVEVVEIVQIRVLHKCGMFFASCLLPPASYYKISNRIVGLKKKPHERCGESQNIAWIT